MVLLLRGSRLFVPTFLLRLTAHDLSGHMDFNLHLPTRLDVLPEMETVAQRNHNDMSNLVVQFGGKRWQIIWAPAAGLKKSMWPSNDERPF